MRKKTIGYILVLAIMLLTFAPMVSAAVPNRTLRLGSRGADVATVQARLNKLGYNAGAADGIFGRRTYNAVVAFQRANGLSVDGIVGKNTRAKLFSAKTTPSRGGSSSSGSKNTGTSTASITSTLRRGSRGSQVTTLQKRLNTLGYNAGTADGIFGRRTYNAVVAFQRANGLSVDGIVGKNTRAKLFSAKTTPSRGGSSSSGSKNTGTSTASITSTLRRGSRGSQVTTLQKRLNTLGYNAGTADGIFGGRTYNAVVAFQRANGLSVDGIVGRNTVAKLFSNIAPKPDPKPTPAPKPQPSPEQGTTVEQMYRVRKSWNDASSQIGAFKSLSNAKALADKNPGYKVFDSSGKAIYPVGESDSEPIKVEGKPIVSKTKSTVKQMEAWARTKGATDNFVDLASIYYAIGSEIGVNPEGAYCQAALETGYGKFGGAVPEEFNNFCGLKTTNGKGDKREDHQQFATREEGVRAHIDHLALYAGADGYPKADTPDPRHFSSITGKATTFKALGGEGKWAPAPDYGDRIERLLEELYKTSY